MPPKKMSSFNDNIRAKKFSNEELQALIDTISPNYIKLFGILNEEITNELKQTLWAQITDAVKVIKIVLHLI
jgi:hypothetical protein